MNCETAKQISITEFLRLNNIQPQKTTQNEIWYCSPFRNEKNASFKVSINQNCWCDFGCDKGGNMLDLACEFYKTNISGALQKLESLNICTVNIPAPITDKIISIESKYKIKHIQSLQNRALIQYCESRKIPFKIATHYLKEIYYSINGKGNWFSLTFQNDKGGYALRSLIFKNCISPKGITSIQGNNKRLLTIFEGFFNFLSACVYYNTITPNSDCIILNSVSNIEAALKIIPTYEKINMFLDNDSSGQEAANKIILVHKNAENFSKKIYPNDNDFNDYIIKIKP